MAHVELTLDVFAILFCPESCNGQHSPMVPNTSWLSCRNWILKSWFGCSRGDDETIHASKPTPHRGDHGTCKWRCAMLQVKQEIRQLEKTTVYPKHPQTIDSFINSFGVTLCLCHYSLFFFQATVNHSDPMIPYRPCRFTPATSACEATYFPGVWIIRFRHLIERQWGRLWGTKWHMGHGHEVLRIIIAVSVDDDLLFAQTWPPLQVAWWSQTWQCLAACVPCLITVNWGRI